MTNANQEQISDALVRKIQLLLNLAERSAGNEAEAAAAMGKAQELLAKYNLDLATVQDKAVQGGPAASKADVKREKAEAKRNATYEWTRKLYRAVAEANYCVYWTIDARMESANGRVRYVKRHRVLGRVENTTAVLVMGDYLYATVMRMLPYDKSSWLDADALAWCDGCVERLAERIRAKAEAMRTPDYATQGEQGYTTALAIRNMAETETIGNYEAVHGKGAWARKLERDAASKVCWDNYFKQQAEKDAAKEDERAKMLASETPEQRARRERKEAAEARKQAEASEKYWSRERARQNREAARRQSSAYRAGRAAGESIGIDAQLDKGADRKKIN